MDERKQYEQIFYDKKCWRLKNMQYGLKISYHLYKKVYLSHKENFFSCSLLKRIILQFSFRKKNSFSFSYFFVKNGNVLCIVAMLYLGYFFYFINFVLKDKYFARWTVAWTQIVIFLRPGKISFLCNSGCYFKSIVFHLIKDRAKSGLWHGHSW